MRIPPVRGVTTRLPNTTPAGSAPVKAQVKEIDLTFGPVGAKRKAPYKPSSRKKRKR